MLWKIAFLYAQNGYIAKIEGKIESAWGEQVDIVLSWYWQFSFCPETFNKK